MPAELTIRILVDNQAPDSLLAEHGFSLWLQADGHTIILDAGQEALLENATRLGLDLTQADSLVLSHGHYDHSGGISDLLAIAKGLVVYTHPAAFLPRYKVTSDASRSIRVAAANLAALNALPEERLRLVRQPLWLSERIGLSGEIPRTNPVETPGGPFFLDPDGRHADAIDDDMALWIKTQKGLVVAVGCCHAGLINTLSWIREITGEERVHAVVGGLHLLNAEEERLAWTIAQLKKMAVGNLVPCHCTGATACQWLARELPCRPGHAGLLLNF
jgi:7,8-dihydropterin-6-yl-methyl-4-(beta-D-ribofuranosyl)aminobenzene 5'-phosphate synthase